MIINAPAELWKLQRDSGELAGLEIIDQNGTKTVLSLVLTQANSVRIFFTEHEKTRKHSAFLGV
jgi:hypothetical protein